MEWEHLFQRKVLTRGFDYFLEGRVGNLTFSEEKIGAMVKGTDNYDVEISLQDGEITRMFCTCPYAQDGKACKHIAAVLYEYENSQEEQDPDSAEDAGKPKDPAGDNGQRHSDERSVEDLIADAPEDLVRRCLSEILRNNDKLAFRFRAYFSQDVSEKDMNRYKKRIDGLIWEYSGRDGFIDYYDAASFLDEVTMEMDDFLKSIWIHRCCLKAFELVCDTFVQVSEVEMDDSDGEFYWFGDKCKQWWETILQEAEKEGDAGTQKTMFEWFAGHMDGSIIDYMEDHIRDFLISHFDRGIMQEKKLALVDDKIAERMQMASERAERFGSWSEDYYLQDWLMARLKIMQTMNRPWNEITDFCKKFWDSHSIRYWYARTCKERGDYEEAILALEQSLKMDSSYTRLVSECCMELKELYRLAGRLQDYQKMLWRIVTEIKPGDLQPFQELREQYGAEEWPEVREELFCSLPEYTSRLELFREEGLFDRLMEGVMSTGGLYAARKYKEELLPLFPEQYLEKYEKEAERSAEHVANRDHYRELAEMLFEIREMPGGPEKADKIEDHWRTAYRNRRAMMDELNQMHRRRKYFEKE